MVRHFGNVNKHQVHNGSLLENGCGKFVDISEKALAEIKALGFTHVWLTGILEHASGTDYPGRKADPQSILKGRAGSPYAVRDYFDVSPDLAQDVENRIEEFSELMVRAHDVGLVVLIDFIPNHVARSYGSDVIPELSFGEGDQTEDFFHRDNHFFYLDDSHGSAPLTLPDGVYDGESQIGRVTGNNAATWTPGSHDWYETVKLNYGHDYRQGRHTEHLEGLSCEAVPRTWKTMDAILAYWQELGVGGFRCDMAHMVPVEYWSWQIERAKERSQDVYFMAEAYDGDPAKLTEDNILHALLEAGFHAVYDGDSYELVKAIYEEGKWANDLDDVLWDACRLHKMLRYAENHDEVRIANPQHFGGHGAQVGRAVSALLYTLGRGPVMLYNGQEVGEPAIGSEGFAGDNGRTSIFDYTNVPELAKWVNDHAYDGGKLSSEQKALRAWYGKLLHALNRPAFDAGDVYGLNYANQDNPDFGRLEGETHSGHWLYAFLRHDPESRDAVLVVVNLSPSAALENIRVQIPTHAREWLGRENPEVVEIELLPACDYVLVELE